MIWKAVKEIHATVELSHHESNAKAKDTFAGVITQIVILDIVFSLDSVITAVGLTENRWVIIVAVILSFAVILFFAKPIGDFILKHIALKNLGSILSHCHWNNHFHGRSGKRSRKKPDLCTYGFCHAH